MALRPSSFACGRLADSAVIRHSVPRRVVFRVALVCVLGVLSWFVVRTYVRAYDPQFGWTRAILFGADFEAQALPRLRTLPHYTGTEPGMREGYDGQFYAQMALDPALRDPDLKRAMDMPAYRARRIGLPLTAYALGGGEPGRILQAYALSNLLFWFVLLGAMCFLLKPRTVRALLCLCGGTLCLGAVASMERSLVDLPAAAVVFAGLAAAGTWGGPVLLAAAVLTRETSLLAAGGFWDGCPPWHGGAWKRLAVLAGAALVPLGLWMLYVNARLGHDNTAGDGNFAWPFQSMYARFVEGLQRCSRIGYHNIFHKWWRGHWLYEEYEMMELLAIVATCAQGLFLALRREWRSPAGGWGSVIWRSGWCWARRCGTTWGPPRACCCR